MYILDFYELSCPEGLTPIINFVKSGVIPIIQIGIPIILIVLGMIDLGKAVTAGKEDEIKKTQQMLVKRAIYAVAIFFVVTIVTAIMGMFADSGESEAQAGSSWKACWKCSGPLYCVGNKCSCNEQ